MRFSFWMCPSRVMVVVAVLTGSAAAPLPAQRSVPPLVERDTASPMRSRLATELDQEVRWTRARREDEPRRYADSAWVDSLRVSARRDAAALIARNATMSVQGRDLDAAARLAVMAGDTALAHRFVATRLAGAKLSLADRATTYLIAIRAFAHHDHPEQLPSAERYAAALDALGTAPEIALYQWFAHYEFSDVYSGLDRSADALRHVRAAVAVVPRMPYEWWVSYGMFLNPSALSVVAEQPDGRAQLAAIRTVFLARCSATPEMERELPKLAVFAKRCRALLTDRIAPLESIGAPAPPIAGNYWLNADGLALQPGDSNHVRGTRTLSMHDGNIHLVALLSSRDAASHDALRFLVRMQQQYGTSAATHPIPLRVHAVVPPSGWWGYQQVDAETELDRLRSIFRDSLGVTFPLAATVGPRRSIGEGRTQLPDDPNFAAWKFPPLNAMAFWLVDAAGRVRKIYGVMQANPELQDRIQRALDALTTEQR